MQIWLNSINFVRLQAVCRRYQNHTAVIMPSLVRHLQAVAFTLVFVVLYPAVRIIATYFPGTVRKYVFKKPKQVGSASDDLDEVLKTMASGLALKTEFGRLRNGILYGDTYVGKPAPNPPVVKMDGVTQVNLLDFAKAGRPLVLNFGSCSWPPFMVKLATMVRLSHEYESVADFVTIYIQEAHATDGWIFQNNEYKIANHIQMKDRIFAAQMLEEKNPAGHLVVDTMSDEVCTRYCAVPERLCIVLDGIVAYYGGRGPFGYKPKEVEDWLKDFASKQK